MTKHLNSWIRVPGLVYIMYVCMYVCMYLCMHAGICGIIEKAS